MCSVSPFFANFNRQIPHASKTCNATDVLRDASLLQSRGLIEDLPQYSLQIILAVALGAALIRWARVSRCRYLLRCSFVFWIISWLLKQTQSDEQICSFVVASRGKSCRNLLLTFQSSLFGATNVAVIFILVVIRYYWISPPNIVKDIDSVGYSHLAEVARRRKVALDRVRSRDPGHLPPVFPNGWIGLIESRDLIAGAVRSVTSIGREFCVFRGADGTAHALDAYCPHLGANLAAGGRVVGDCVECPFHGWQFDGRDGKCTRIPYSNKGTLVPDVARTKSWPICEANGFVYVWFHADGEPPSWQMPAIAPVQDRSWVYRGRTDHTVRCHIQEIPENGADVAHLNHLHSTFVALGPDPDPSSGCGAIRHGWEPRWQPDIRERHVARMTLNHELRLFGVKVPLTRIELDVRQIGPATVHLHLSTDFGRGVVVQSITPEAPLRQRVVHHVYTEPRFRQWIANVLVVGEEIMFCRDIAMWNNKKFIRNPILMKEDKLISRYRRWYSQFYSSGSPTLEEVRDGTLDW